MKKKNVYYVVIALLLCIAAFTGILNAAEKADKEVLIVAVDYPPYEFEFPKGDLKGFDVEVTEEAFRRAGIKVRFEFFPWKRAMQMVKEGNATGALSCAKMPDRESFIIFSDPISRMTDIFLVRKDYKGPDISYYAQLKKLKLIVGTVRGDAYIERCKAFGIPYDLSPSYEVAKKKLIDGRIDIMPTLLENFLYTGRETNLTDHFKWFEMKEDFLVKDFHVCFCKKWPGVENIVTVFNEKLAEIKKDGTYDAIHSKYR
ncbi:transporter substrate-binding domain-containing protein [Desulfococcaceae bacterium HSG9]|nr:transporter substrate-binding domain-containing protein [Desulfococcaceae bacterium HSG9]